MHRRERVSAADRGEDEAGNNGTEVGKNNKSIHKHPSADLIGAAEAVTLGVVSLCSSAWSEGWEADEEGVVS